MEKYPNSQNCRKKYQKTIDFSSFISYNIDTVKERVPRQNETTNDKY